MASLTAIELGADTCAFARTTVRRGEVHLSAAEILDPAAFPGADAFTVGVRQIRRSLRLPRRCRVVQAAGTVGRRAVLGFRDLEHAYRSGTVIVVRVWRADRIGKYTRFTIMRGKAPRRVDQCLVPGANRGSRCPSA